MKKILGFLSGYKKLLIPVLIVILFIVLLAASVYKITIDDGIYKEDDWSSAPYAASTYTQGAKISGNGIETTQTAQELWDKMNQNGSNVSKYLDTPEELEKLMKAEIVTQYPKIGVGNGKLDGIIEFKRAVSDGSVKGLKYVDEATFNSYIEEYNTNGTDNASKYFTIDSAGNVLMSQWTKVTTVTTVSQNGSSSSNTEVSYSMTTTSINYKSVVQKYSMPFDYLWAFLVMGDDKNLVLELADYVLEDSTIEITGFENKTSATDHQEESEQVEVQVPVEVENPETGEKTTEMQTETQTKTTTIETTVESNNVTADLTVADTWIMDYKKDYKYENDNWVAGEVKSDPKVDRDSEKKNKGRNFVTIFNRYYNARKNIIGSASWLFEILESNTSTANMVDLTKYLLYKATGTNYGVDDDNFDFNEYENNAFFTAGSAGGTLSLTTPTLDKETFVEAMKAYSAKAGGNKSNFDKNFLPYAEQIYDWSVVAGINPELVVVTAKAEGGFGQSGGTYNYWGIGVPNGSKVGTSYGSFQAGISGYAQTILKYQSGSFASMINNLANVRKEAGVDPLGYGAPDTLSGMQSIYSDLGNHEYGSSGKGGYYYMDPARAGVTKIYATHAEFLSKCSNSGSSEHALNTKVTEWENGQYTAWQVEGKLKNWELIFGNYGTLSGGGNTEIIEIAKSKMGCPYLWGAKGPSAFDCSGFVYWVYKQVGINVPGSTSAYKSYKGSNKEIDWNSAQPGDILIIFDTERNSGSGHAGIYLGNDEYIHAPQTGDVVKISSGAKSKFKHVFRFN